MTEAKLKKILATGEGIGIEFKKSQNALPENVFESVCAFLNRIGGDLLLGVKDSGIVVGIEPEKVESIKTDLVNLSNNPNKLDPPFMIFPEVFTLEGKKVIYARVPQSSQVHRSGKYIFDRNADGDFKVTSSAAISRLYQRKSAYFSENKIYPFLQFTDFNESVFRKVRNLIQSHRPDHPWLTISNDELLKSAGLYRRDFETGKAGYTLAAALLFAKDDVLQQIVPAYKTDALLRLKDLDHYDDRREIRTNLIDAYDEIMLFIRAHLPDKFYMEGDIRVDLREKIFREVVANILIHREYTNAFPARLIIQRDSVITENANNPVGHGPIDPDNFNPHPKNPAIVKFFQQLGRAEELGSGIRNIKKYLPLYGNNAQFEFIEHDNFKTVLTIPEIYTELREISSEITSGKMSGKTSGKIIQLILKNKFITIPEMAKEIGVTERTIERNIQSLQRQQILKRVGPAKGGHWEIIKQE
ncbi:putative DNA binding domain-containing protein [candidate division KSB1 bacterium]|nr:putative DNA binding domain-containing protein [candidate division KSB1 bacterium]